MVSTLFREGKYGKLIPPLLILLLWLSSVRLPAPPEIGLDPSWQQSLIRAHTAGLQYGTDIVFTYGPWGFLWSDYHLGSEGAEWRLIWECLGKLLLAWGLLAMLADTPLWRRAALVGLVAMLHPIAPEALSVGFIAVAVTRILLAEQRSVWPTLGVMIALGFFAQVKLTFGALALAGAGLSVLLAIGARRWRSVGWVVGFGFLGLIGWWLAAGQGIRQVPDYVRGSWEIITGYDAMAVEEAPFFFWIGIGVLGVFGFILWRLERPPSAAQHLSRVTFLVLVLILSWKHAFTRTDHLHIAGLFVVGAYLGVILPWLVGRSAPFGRIDFGWILCFAVIGSAGMVEVTPILTFPARLSSNAVALSQLASLPERWNEELAVEQKREAIPELASLVGSAGVDVFNFNQGLAHLSGIKLRPRPVFQGYSAYTPYLGALNESYYESAQAPELIIWRQQTIDRRFPTQDDAWIFRGLKQDYRVVHAATQFVLLRRQKKYPESMNAAGVPETYVRRTLVLGEPYRLDPALAGKALWLRVKAVPSLLGRLRGLVYKPAAFYLITEDSRERVLQWRIVKKLAADPGFLLQPMLITNRELMAYFEDEMLPDVRTVGFSSLEGAEKYWSHFELEIEDVAARH